MRVPGEFFLALNFVDADNDGYIINGGLQFTVSVTENAF